MSKVAPVPTQSKAPDGTVYEIPSDSAIAAGFEELRGNVEERRSQGLKIVVVQGLGFVGAAVAAVLAGARDSAGKPVFFVIGADLATPEAYWKVARINSGQFPVPSPDPALAELLGAAVATTGNLRAATHEEVYGLADVIVVDVPLDAAECVTEEGSEIRVRIAPFEKAIDVVGRRMRPDALVLLETTVPVGACEKIVLPLLTRLRQGRGIFEPPLLAHAYERVMPGPRYADSIRRFWRSYSGIDERSAAAARDFLQAFIDVDAFPAWRLPDTNSSELAKLLENSYRAVNIAFIQEWTLLAEKLEVNLFEVIESIRVRKGTHDNMRFPGFGVGGYCLTKDSLLAQWGADSLFHADVKLGMTLEALRINRAMPLHTLDLAAELSGGALSGKRVAVAGVSYLPEVADTRNTPSEILVDALAARQAEPLVHDPYVAVWPERPLVPMAASLEECLRNADGLILAVPHAAYRGLTAEAILQQGPRLAFVVDAQNVLSDDAARGLHSQGIRVAGVGKGHWRKRRYHE